MLERRQTSRKHISANVYLAGLGRAFGRCTARDISTDGVFVETSALGLPLGKKVKLVFAVPAGQVVKIHQISAVVARVSRKGAAMLFCSRTHPNRIPPRGTLTSPLTF